MYTYHFNISVGDIIDSIIAITAIIALIYQNRSLMLTEKELKTKVTDVEEIVKKLEIEKNERIDQIEERKNQELFILNHTNTIANLNSKSSRSREILLCKDLQSLNLSVVLLSKVVKDLIIIQNTDLVKEGGEEKIPVLKVFDKVINKSILEQRSYEDTIWFNDQMAELDNKWNDAMAKANKDFINNSLHKEEIQKALDRLEVELSVITKEYSKRLELFKKDFDLARMELDVALKDMLKIN